MSIAAPCLSRTHHSPLPLSKPRVGCPCALTPVHKITTLPQGERTEVVHEFTTMQLVHLGKAGALKNSLDLRPLHHDLQLHSLVLSGPGSSNILLAKVSFDCLIVDGNGNKVRDYISFDLTIPGSYGTGIFSYDFIKMFYAPEKRAPSDTEKRTSQKAQENLYKAIEHFYKLGNPASHKHGHRPDYDATDSSQDQYIRHTEQLLVAYLGLKEAAQMLCNRLRTEIRAKYAGAQGVKVYNMGLHMHSTKTCCAPCEYALIGLMNDPVGFKLNGRTIGFLPNFQEEASYPNNQLALRLPKRNPFKMIVTVTASEPDAHHRSPPSYEAQTLSSEEAPLPYNICVRDPIPITRVFTTLLASSFDRRKFPVATHLLDTTVAISGSESTPGSPKTMEKVKEIRKGERRSAAKRLFREAE